MWNAEKDKINENYKEIAGDYRSELGSPGEVSGKDQGRVEKKVSKAACKIIRGAK